MSVKKLSTEVFCRRIFASYHISCIFIVSYFFPKSVMKNIAYKNTIVGMQKLRHTGRIWGMILEYYSLYYIFLSFSLISVGRWYENQIKFQFVQHVYDRNMKSLWQTLFSYKWCFSVHTYNFAWANTFITIQWAHCSLNPYVLLSLPFNKFE